MHIQGVGLRTFSASADTEDGPLLEVFLSPIPTSKGSSLRPVDSSPAQISHPFQHIVSSQKALSKLVDRTELKADLLVLRVSTELHQWAARQTVSCV